MTTITISEALDLGRATLILVMQLGAPILLIGMGVGLIISLFQAVTQIQEQTLSFVPKMIAMAVAAMVFMPWMSNKTMEFARQMFGNIYLAN